MFLEYVGYLLKISHWSNYHFVVSWLSRASTRRAYNISEGVLLYGRIDSLNVQLNLLVGLHGSTWVVVSIWQGHCLHVVHQGSEKHLLLLFIFVVLAFVYTGLAFLFLAVHLLLLFIFEVLAFAFMGLAFLFLAVHLLLLFIFAVLTFAFTGLAFLFLAVCSFLKCFFHHSTPVLQSYVLVRLAFAALGPSSFPLA